MIYEIPAMFGYIGAVWAKTYEEAIALLETGEVSFCSLDHDLTVNQTLGNEDGEKTGHDVLIFIEQYNLWPVDGMACHSQNASGRLRILQGIEKHYGKLFQYPYRLN